MVAWLCMLIAVVSVGVSATERLIFSDNFDTLDFKKWQHEITMGGGGNWEFEMYVNNRTNSFVKDGKLHIKPTLTVERLGEAKLRSGHNEDIWGSMPGDACTSNMWWGCFRTSTGANIINPVQSARLRTAQSFAFKYGRVEFKAKLPEGDWIWPALWMLPLHNAYGNWPASGEIDIMESRGNLNYPASSEGGPESYSSSLHWGPIFELNRWTKTHQHYTLPGAKFSDDFHTFGLKWTKDRIFTYVDDESNVVLDVDMSQQSMWDKGQFPPGVNNPWEGGDKNTPFDQEYFLVMNVAVGGTSGYFADGVAGKCWTNNEPQAMTTFYNNRGAWEHTWNEKTVLTVDSVNVWAFDAEEEVKDQL